MSNGIFVVTGQTESGDSWNLVFNGEPTYERINYVYAQEFPEEWDYMSEAQVDWVIEAEPRHEADGPELEDGEERPGRA